MVKIIRGGGRARDCALNRRIAGRVPDSAVRAGSPLYINNGNGAGAPGQALGYLLGKSSNRKGPG